MTIQIQTERTSIILPKKYQTAVKLARFIQTQSAGSQFDLALNNPPPLAKVAALLPTGTVFRDNMITLPNGTVIAFVPRKTDKQYEAEFLAKTETRDQLIGSLKSLAKNATVYVKEPRGGTVVVRGDVDLAIKIAQSLPSGTFVTAKVGVPQTTIRYPRID